MAKIKESKEFKNVKKAINEWAGKHKGNVLFIGSFMAFNKKQDVIEDIMFAYGDKECIGISLGSLIEEVCKEKENFVNW